MTIKQHALLGGIMGTLEGIVGMHGLIGPDANRSLFGTWFYTNPVENRGHLFFGLLFLFASLFLPLRYQRYIFGFTGALALFLVYVTALGPIPEGVSFLGTQLQNPGDNILHIFNGISFMFLAFATIADEPKKTITPATAKI